MNYVYILLLCCVYAYMLCVLKLVYTLGSPLSETYFLFFNGSIKILNLYLLKKKTQLKLAKPN